MNKRAYKTCHLYDLLELPNNVQCSKASPTRVEVEKPPSLNFSVNAELLVRETK
jgi:hypothetical protein